MLATEEGGDMLILLTGVGGALSALGLDIPAGQKERISRQLSVDSSRARLHTPFNKEKVTSEVKR